MRLCGNTQIQRNNHYISNLIWNGDSPHLSAVTEKVFVELGVGAVVTNILGHGSAQSLCYADAISMEPIPAQITAYVEPGQKVLELMSDNKLGPSHRNEAAPSLGGAQEADLDLLGRWNEECNFVMSVRRKTETATCVKKWNCNRNNISKEFEVLWEFFSFKLRFSAVLVKPT